MPGDSGLPSSGELVAGKYRIERQLGAGGMGAVFEATHRVTGKRFAVKWLLPEMSEHADAAKRFIREAQVAGRFEHPNVVEVYDVGQEHGSFYMVMELLVGQSLAERLLRTPRLSVDEACQILVPCMRGVARAHSAGIVHRDLKPANIFLCAATVDTPEVPKVLDFGISKMSNLAGEVDSSITKTGMVMGTPHYMSPEQVRGRAVDHRADVYAFGVIFYQVLSGQLPFPADTFSELVLQIATETPKPLDELVRQVPSALVQVVNRAMARDPNDRYQDLDALIKALAPFASARSMQESAARAVPQVSASRPQGTGGSRSTIPLDTPLATESNSFDVRPPKPRGLILLVAAAAIGVVVLGILLSRLLPSDKAKVAAAEPASPTAVTKPEKSSAGQNPPPPNAANAAPVEPPANEPALGADNGEDPHPKTIRLTPEPEERPRTWEPPPGHRPQAEEAPIHEDKIGDLRESSASDKSHKHHPHTSENTRGTPPAPTSNPEAKPAGRLGIEMNEHEF